MAEDKFIAKIKTPLMKVISAERGILSYLKAKMDNELDLNLKGFRKEMVLSQEERIKQLASLLSTERDMIEDIFKVGADSHDTMMNIDFEDRPRYYYNQTFKF